MELISKVEFARRVGISKAMVSRLSKTHLAAAIVAGQINIDAECVTDYIQAHQKRINHIDISINSSAKTKVSTTDIPSPHETKLPKADTDVSEFEKMTLAELCNIFGTDEKFKIWLNGRKTIIDIKFKELSLVEASGKLISRKLVEHGVVNTFNSAHLRLLKDGAKSITAGVLSKHGGGAELAEIELFVTDILGSFIKPIKSKIVRILKDA